MFVSGADGLVTIVQGRGAFSDFEKSDFRIFLRSEHGTISQPLANESAALGG